MYYPVTPLKTGNNVSEPKSEKPNVLVIITDQQRANRKLLASVMMIHGFKPLKEEWWHFSFTEEPFPETYFDFPID